MSCANREERPLSEAERLVNVHYLGHCLHENRSVWLNPHIGWCSRCWGCRREIVIPGYIRAGKLPDDVLAGAWSLEHVQTASSPINSAQLRHVLEQAGWQVLLKGLNGRTVCEVRRDSVSYRTRFFDSWEEAMVEAAAMTLKYHGSRRCACPICVLQSPH